MKGRILLLTILLFAVMCFGGVTAVYAEDNDLDTTLSIAAMSNMKKVENVSPHYTMYTFLIFFDREVSKTAQINIGGTDAFKDSFLLNGKTLGEYTVLDYIGSDGATSLKGSAVQMHLQGGRVAQIYATMETDLKAEGYGLKLDGTDTFEIRSGFTIGGYTVATTKTYTYDPVYTEWEGFTYEHPDVGSVSVKRITPFQEIKGNNQYYTGYGNFSFNIVFDKDITYRQFPHLNATAMWLYEVGTNPAQSFKYTVNEITYLCSSGVRITALKNILINGKTLRELMNEEPREDVQVSTVMLHASDGQALDNYCITFTEDTANELNQEYINTHDMTLELKKGLVVPNGYVLDRDYKFYFDSQTKNWYEEGEAVPDYSFDNEVIDGAPNIKDGCAAVLSGNVLAGTAVVLIGSILLFKKRGTAR